MLFRGPRWEHWPIGSRRIRLSKAPLARGFCFALLPVRCRGVPFPYNPRARAITAVTHTPGLTLTPSSRLLTFTTGGRMKDIHEVLRQKQTKYAQLGKQIEMLQQAAEKLREVAPLLAENDDEDNAVLMEVDEASDAMAAKAAAAGAGATGSKAARPTTPRWP